MHLVWTNVAIPDECLKAEPLKSSHCVPPVCGDYQGGWHRPLLIPWPSGQPWGCCWACRVWKPLLLDGSQRPLAGRSEPDQQEGVDPEGRSTLHDSLPWTTATTRYCGWRKGVDHGHAQEFTALHWGWGALLFNITCALTLQTSLG